MKKYIFLDRDGTINVDHGYVCELDKLEFIESSIEALKLLSEKGYELVIVTNQSGIGRGMFSEEKYLQFHNEFIKQLGLNVEMVYCPHTPDENCDCRKPALGMVDKFEIDLENSFMVGDKISDIEFGNRLGVKTCLVKTGKAGSDVSYDVKADLECADLLAFAEKICNKKVVFTNGCFDVLHVGHVRLLNKAKSFGDVLIVGVNTDASVKRLKGENRPINCQEDRVEMLKNLRAVDKVVLFDEDDSCKMISELKPDIHVKGGDYDPNDYSNMPEAKVVHEYGGKVEIIPIVEGKSSTNVIERMRR